MFQEEESRRVKTRRNDPKYKLTEPDGTVQNFKSLVKIADHLNVPKTVVCKYFENKALYKYRKVFANRKIEYANPILEKHRKEIYGEQKEPVKKKYKENPLINIYRNNKINEQMQMIKDLEATVQTLQDENIRLHLEFIADKKRTTKLLDTIQYLKNQQRIIDYEIPLN